MEACDDGNRVQTDTCLNDCTSARCGDAIVQDGVEACDDGNQVQTDACLNDCTSARCGDSIVQAGVEACDDGNQVDTDQCTSQCRSTLGLIRSNPAPERRRRSERCVRDLLPPPRAWRR